MTLNQLRAFGLGALLVSGVSTQAMAELSQNVYAGAGLGMSNYSSIEDLFLGYEENTESDIDDSSIGYQFFAGWEIVPKYFALEFSYIDFGAAESETSSKVVNDGEEKQIIESADLTTSAVGLALKGMLPLGESLSLFGKLGYAKWAVDGKLKGKEYVNGELNDSYSGSIEDVDGDDFFYAIGAEYHYSKNLSFYAEYLKQEAEYDIEGVTFNFFEASIISAGINWRFDAPRRRSGSRGSESNGETDSGKRNITACDEKYKDVSGIICQE